MNLNGNNLEGYSVAMVDAKTDEVLETFTSIGKARRVADINAKRGSFENKVYKHTVMSITYKSKQMDVYFKEVI